MNLILFEAAEIEQPLPRSDRRAQHLLQVLRRNPGDTFDAGIINGPRGQGTLLSINPDSVACSFRPLAIAPPPELITLLIGLPRPQTARDILRDATTLGVAGLHFVRTERSEASYAQSHLWTSGEWRRHLIAGAEQAFVTHLPACSWGRTLVEAAELDPAAVRLAMDNYEAPGALSGSVIAGPQPVVLAIGGERGWSPGEREVLRRQGFQFHHLGPRVLRTETACTVALALIRAKLGLM